MKLKHIVPIIWIAWSMAMSQWIQAQTKASEVSKSFDLKKTIQTNQLDINGEKTGLWVVYHENGRKALEVFFQNGESNWPEVEYYESGNKKIEWENKQGIRHGRRIEYYENGKKKAEWPWENGKQQWVFTFYGEDGKVTEIKLYKNGEIIE